MNHEPNKFDPYAIVDELSIGSLLDNQSTEPTPSGLPKKQYAYFITKHEAQFKLLRDQLKARGIQAIRVMEDAAQLRGLRRVRVFILHTGMDRWSVAARRALYMMAKHGNHSLYRMTHAATEAALAELVTLPKAGE